MSRRITALALIFGLAFTATAGRLFFLQVFKYTYYEAAAEGQQAVERPVESRRGTIFARAKGVQKDESVPLALTRRSWDGWVVPQKVGDNTYDTLSTQLASLLDMEREDILARISKKEDPYEPLKSSLDEKTRDALLALDSEALGVTPVQGRYYPAGTLASHVLGFVSRNAESDGGQYGIEEYFNGQLSGEEGFVKGFRNPFGQLISALSNISRPQDGADVYLTLDYNVQRTLEKYLSEARDTYNARSAQGVIVNPRTGEVIALASVPAFDPNTYSDEEDLSVFLNPVVQSRYEPGSVFKPLTMAAALDIHVVSPEMTYTDRGMVQVAGATLRNSGNRTEGVQTMTQVLEKSLNTGAVFAVNRIPGGVWREYVENFGLSEKTGVELAGEVTSDIGNIEKGGPVEMATSAFGQGVAVTPLALTMAIGALANDGVLMRPYIVDKVVSIEGETLYEARPRERRRVISADTAEDVTRMMVSVVENGSGWGARMENYWVAGKTGTAQIASEGGYSDEVNHTFVGYAPAFDPSFVMLVKLENPQGVTFSEVSVGPLFKKISSFILNYYGIEPTKPLD